MIKKNIPEQVERLEVRFSDHPVATISLQNGRIVWEINEAAAEISGFTSTQLHQFVARLVDAPLERRLRRKQTLPHLFSEIEPNSTEHYLELIRDCGPFSVVPIQIH